jgi:hypothetical protein
MLLIKAKEQNLGRKICLLIKRTVMKAQMKEIDFNKVFFDCILLIIFN